MLTFVNLYIYLSIVLVLFKIWQFGMVFLTGRKLRPVWYVDFDADCFLEVEIIHCGVNFKF